MNKFAYITYLGTDDYLPGTLALIQSLQSVKSKYPIYVFCSSNLSNTTISLLKDKSANILKSHQKFKIPTKVVENNNKKVFSRWNRTFEKLQIFGLEQFDKVVMLDSDMLIKQNIDELFTKPNLSAVCAGKSYPGNENWKNLNSGIVVITPNKNTLKRLISLIGLDTPGDQDVIRKALPS